MRLMVNDACICSLFFPLKYIVTFIFLLSIRCYVNADCEVDYEYNIEIKRFYLLFNSFIYFSLLIIIICFHDDNNFSFIREKK